MFKPFVGHYSEIQRRFFLELSAADILSESTVQAFEPPIASDIPFAIPSGTLAEIFPLEVSLGDSILDAFCGFFFQVPLWMFWVIPPGNRSHAPLEIPTRA